MYLMRWYGDLVTIFWQECYSRYAYMCLSCVCIYNTTLLLAWLVVYSTVRWFVRMKVSWISTRLARSKRYLINILKSRKLRKLASLSIFYTSFTFYHLVWLRSLPYLLRTFVWVFMCTSAYHYVRTDIRLNGFSKRIVYGWNPEYEGRLRRW